MPADYAPAHRFRRAPIDPPLWFRLMLATGAAIAILVGVYRFYHWRAELIEQDLKGVRASTMTVKVLDKRMLPRGISRLRIGQYDFEILFSSSRGEFRSSVIEDDYDRVRTGQTVRLTYRVGRESGKVYVDRIEPIESERARAN